MTPSVTPTITVSPSRPVGGVRYQASGSAISGAASVDAVWPTHQANDIGILLVETANEALSTPTGWTDIYTPTGVGSAGGTGARLYAFWKRAASSSEANVTTGDSGDHQLAIILTYRGCRTSATPIDVTATSTASSGASSVSIGGVTVSEANNELLYCVGTFGVSPFSGEANASLSSVTEIADVNYSSTSLIGAWKGLLASTGASGTLTANVSASTAREMLCVSFLSVNA
jgi:hypothetical protein